MRRVGWSAVVFAFGVSQAACAADPTTAVPGTPRFSLHQKGRFQALYDANGKMVRLLEDRDGDGWADVVVVFGASGRLERGEMDTDRDGVVDRREHFAPDGSLLRVEVTSPDSVPGARGP